MAADMSDSVEFGDILQSQEPHRSSAAERILQMYSEPIVGKVRADRPTSSGPAVMYDNISVPVITVPESFDIPVAAQPFERSMSGAAGRGPSTSKRYQIDKSRTSRSVETTVNKSNGNVPENVGIRGIRGVRSTISTGPSKT